MTDSTQPSPDLVAGIAAQIDQAATCSIDATDLPRHLASPEVPSDLRAVAVAFRYYSGWSGKRSPGEAYFRPQSTFNGKSDPTEFSDIPPPVRLLWEAVADAVTEPLALARLHDVCFEAKWDRPGDHAMRAAEAYLAVARRPIQDSEGWRMRGPLARTKALARALELARVTGQSALEAEIMDFAAATATEELDVPSPKIGSPLGLVDILIDGGDDPARIDGLLRHSRSVFAGNPDSTEKVIELELKVAGPDDTRRRQLHRELVANAVAKAERMSGAARMGLLDRAAQMARSYGLGEMYDEIVVTMQGIRIEDLELIRHGYTISISEEALDSHVAMFIEAPSWQDALVRLCRRAPSGEVEANRATAAFFATQTPLMSTFARARVGDDGLTRVVSATDEEKQDAQLTDQEMQQLRIQGGTVALILGRIWEKWGPIPEEDLASFFAGGHVESELAGALARDFLRYWVNDPEGAAYTASARVEALARSLAQALGLAVYKVQQGRNPGQYQGLGALLKDLRARDLDESWYRFLYSFLASQTGANARNEILHGAVDEVQTPVAALVLVGALFLTKGVAVNPRSDSVPDAEGPSDERLPGM